MTVAPPLLVADGGSQPVLYVQLLGTDGHPVVTLFPVEIALFSSNPGTVRVPGRVQVPPGSSYVIAPVTTSLVPGTATITAVGDGKSSQGIEVETKASSNKAIPVGVQLHVAPPTLLSGGVPPGQLAVTLVDDQGVAVKARETVDVLITSSNPDAVRPVNRVTIPRGEYFAVSSLDQGEAGSAVLTAVLPGYLSQPMTVNVVDPGGVAEALTVHLLPQTLRSSSREQPAAIVQAVDAQGKPVFFPCTTVHLASSAPEVAVVPPLLRAGCEGDLQYASLPVRPGTAPGTASLTAAATGLRPASATVSLRRQVPIQLRAYLAPQELLGVERSPGFLVVQVLDKNAVPVRDHGGISVTLAGVGKTLDDVLVIPDGRSYTMLGLGETVDPIDWWVLGPGLASAKISGDWTRLSTTVDAVFPEGPFFTSDEKEVVVTVRSGGVPVPGAQLRWAATHGTLRNASSVTDANGQGDALLRSDLPGDGTLTVTASKSGYAEASWGMPVNIVAVAQDAAESPKLLGLPVVFWFVAFAILLTAYIVVGLIRRPWPRPNRKGRATAGRRKPQPGLLSAFSAFRLPAFTLAAPRRAQAARNKAGRKTPARKQARKAAPASAKTRRKPAQADPGYPVRLDEEELSVFKTRHASEVRGLGRLMAQPGMLSEDDRQFLEDGAAVRGLEEVARTRLERGDLSAAQGSAEKAIAWAEASEQRAVRLGRRPADSTHLWLLLAAVHHGLADAAGTASALERAMTVARRAGRFDDWAEAIGQLTESYTSGPAGEKAA